MPSPSPTELVIAGRRALPPGPRPWTFELEHLPDDGEDDDEDGDGDDEDALGEGELLAFEAPPDERAFHDEVARVVGFAPAAVVVVRPASWRMSELVAEVIARALEAVIYVRAPGAAGGARPVFDARARAEPADTLDELEDRIERAYDTAGPLAATLWR